MAFSSAVPDRSGHKFPNVGIEDLPNWIPVYEKPAFTPQKKLRVVLIGAGFAGLTVAHKLKYQYPEVNKYLDFTIYEKNEDIGGTWVRISLDSAASFLQRPKEYSNRS